MGLDITPVAVAFLSLIGSIATGYLAYKSGQRTKRKVETIPADLVKEFSRLNPGVDTVEKVIELLYAEIGRLNTNNETLTKRVDRLITEKQELLDEITSLKGSLADHKLKLDYLEERIKKSIGDPDDNQKA